MATTGTYAPDPDLHVVDANGLPVNGGLVWTYIAGTLTPVATYTDVALSVPNSNPIVAGPDGRFVAFLAPGNSYKFVFETAATPPAHGAVLATRDNISAVPISSPSTDISGPAGEALAAGTVVYISSGAGGKNTGQWYLADADLDYASSLATTIGVTINTTPAGTAGLFRVSGQVSVPGAPFTPGALYYVSQTAGGVVTPAPVSPAYMRLVGQALDTTTIAVGMPGTNLAKTDVTNVFTAKQVLQYATPRLNLIDTSQPADQKVFQIVNSAQKLYLQSLNDAETAGQGAVNIDRIGNVAITSGALAVGPAPMSTSPGDVTVCRNSAPTTGVVYFGNAGGTRYLYYDGSQFLLAGPLTANGYLIGTGNADFRPGTTYLGRFAEKNGITSLSGGVVTFDMTNGNYGAIVLNQNVTSFSFVGMQANLCNTVTMLLRQDATGGRTVAFSAGYLQSGWTMPAAANAWAVLVFVYDPLVTGVWMGAPYFSM